MEDAAFVQIAPRAAGQVQADADDEVESLLDELDESLLLLDELVLELELSVLVDGPLFELEA